MKKLYEAYNFLTADKDIENDEPTEIIQQIYDTARDIKANGGYLFDQELVYNYRSFIELSYKGLGNRIEKE